MANNLGMVFANRIERNPSPISPSAEPAASLDEFSFGFEGLGDAKGYPIYQSSSNQSNEFGLIKCKAQE
jgi:hypothetical protein